MKTILSIRNLILCLSTLFIFSTSCISQNQDSKENKICIEKIKELYGSDTSLDGPLSITEVEKRNLVPIEKDGQKITVPFGFVNDKWLEIKAEMKKGDKIFEFSTGPDSWAHLAGRAGVIVLRGEFVVGTVITTMN